MLLFILLWLLSLYGSGKRLTLVSEADLLQLASMPSNARIGVSQNSPRDEQGGIVPAIISPEEQSAMLFAPTARPKFALGAPFVATIRDQSGNALPIETSTQGKFAPLTCISVPEGELANVKQVLDNAGYLTISQ